MAEKQYKRNYYYIIGVYLVINILWMIKINTQPFSDFEYYNALAKQISLGGSWGDTYTSVGYPIFLAFFYKIFGANILVAKIVNLILSLLTILLFKKILDFTSMKEKGKLIVFALFAFFPSTIFYNTILCSEVLFTFLLLLVTYIYFNKNIKLKYLYLGILTGLLTMVKPFFIVYFFAIFLLELIFNGNILKTIRNSTIILVVSVLVLAPWIYRNTKFNGELTYVSNNGGIVMYINNNSQNTFGRWMPASDVENSIVNTEEYKNSNMTKKNKMLKKAATNWIKSNPKDFIILGFKRLGNTYFVGDDIYYSLHGSNLSESAKFKVTYVYAIFRALAFLVALIYIIRYSLYIILCLIKRCVHKLDKFSVYLCIIFYMFTSVYFITEGQARYSFPMVFIFCYMFYSFIHLISKKFKRRKIK